MENNRVLPALLNCWSELLAVLGCQGFPKTLQGLTEGKLNKAQQAGRLNLQQVSLRLKYARLISWDHKVSLQQRTESHIDEVNISIDLFTLMTLKKKKNTVNVLPLSLVKDLSAATHFLEHNLNLKRFL